MSPRGPGNSGDIDFFHMQSRGKIPALRVCVGGGGDMVANDWCIMVLELAVS